jgi:hypothetical protein
MGFISSLTGSAKKALKAQQDATDIANRKMAQGEEFVQGKYAPLEELGTAGRNEYAQRLGLGGDQTNPLYGSLMHQFTGEDLYNTPGYQFGLGQGIQAQDRSAAAAGGLQSGAALKAAQRFGQDYAGTKFQEGYNRDAADKERIANYLQGITNMGTNAIGTLSDLRMNVAGNRAQNALNMGNARAAKAVSQGKGWDDLFNTGVNAAMLGAGGGFGGLGGMAAGMGGGAASGGGMSGFSSNLLQPNFAQNFQGFGGGGGGFNGYGSFNNQYGGG